MTNTVTKQISTDTKKIGTIHDILSNHHEYNKTKCSKPTNSGSLNNIQLNHQLVKEEVEKEIKDFLDFNENEYTT